MLINSATLFMFGPKYSTNKMSEAKLNKNILNIEGCFFLKVLNAYITHQNRTPYILPLYLLFYNLLYFY